MSLPVSRAKRQLLLDLFSETQSLPVRLSVFGRAASIFHIGGAGDEAITITGYFLGATGVMDDDIAIPLSS